MYFLMFSSSNQAYLSCAFNHCSSNFPANQDLGASVGSNFSEYSTTTNATETEGDSTEYEQSNASQFDFGSYNQMVRNKSIFVIVRAP